MSRADVINRVLPNYKAKPLPKAKAHQTLQPLPGPNCDNFTDTPLSRCSGVQICGFPD